MKPNIIVLAIAGLALVSCGETDADRSANLAADKLEAAAAIESAPEEPTSPWSYRTDRDEMRDAETKFASISSVNDVPVSWPYTQAPARLMLRRSPANGLDIMILIEGQFTCGLSRESVAVKFDDGPIQTYGCSEAVGGTGVLFIHSPQRFLTNLKAAKKVIIEMPVYEAGTVQMTWDIPMAPDFT